MAILKWKSQEEIDKEVAEANAPTEEELQMKAVRFAVQKLVRIDELSPDELNSIMMLYDEFVDYGQLYKTGDVFRYEETLYKVVQEHVSQKDWIPSDTPALYTKVTDDGLIEVWGNRDLTVNPFMTGDKVIFEDVVYVSIIDNNVWSPIEYPTGWIKEE